MTLQGSDRSSLQQRRAVGDDSHDTVRFEQRLPNDMDAVRAALEPFRDGLSAVAVESTYNCYWLVDGLMVDGLMDGGVDVRLANTAAVPQYAGLKHGDDHSDARHLAKLLRLGILPEGFISARERRGVRDLLRRRFQLVRQRVAIANTLQSAWSRRTGHGLRTNDLQGVTADGIRRDFADPNEQLAVLSHPKLWRFLHAQTEQIERWVLQDIKGRPALTACAPRPASAWCWAAPSCWRRGRSSASPRWATTPRTVAWSPARGSPTASSLSDLS